MPSRKRKSRSVPPVQFLPRTQVPCLSCGLCCTYVTADIDPPSSVPRASRILWYLYHEGVSVYWDRGATWLVQFETRCRFFGEDRRCEIYARRPHVCRDFDERECEVNAPDEGLLFHEPAQFVAWLKQRRPRLLARMVRQRLVPSAAALRGPAPVRPALPPFLGRYVQLRAAGQARIQS
jgi:Fe-S-cluster containining protein